MATENAKLWLGDELAEAVADFADDRGLDPADLYAKVANPTIFDLEDEA
jgi:hypothetical protein